MDDARDIPDAFGGVSEEGKGTCDALFSPLTGTAAFEVVRLTLGGTLLSPVVRPPPAPLRPLSQSSASILLRIVTPRHPSGPSTPEPVKLLTVLLPAIDASSEPGGTYDSP